MINPAATIHLQSDLQQLQSQLQGEHNNYTINEISGDTCTLALFIICTQMIKVAS